ncbi:IMPACT family member YigZ [BD1-7 clade bacterium]|uniref:IMPACT family member YigZ n=1 Tax=BD1-7 clade bacterium TaxID=2029982 RepID=A0A5S9R1E0_9GAMM|nr:IMPACT family member YigZ [BD1-7 clade bacterium]
MKKTYAIPAAMFEHRYEIKKSAFIARVHHCTSKPAAKELLAQARRDYPDARHHCWAYTLGNPLQPHSAAMSDDGEPSGTAGKPILNVLNHSDIGDVMIIVIRYFGGIKLGAGGLVRAYSAASQQAIDLTHLAEHIPKQNFTLELDYQDEKNVRHLLDQYKGELLDTHYDSRVTLQISFPIDSQDTLTSMVNANYTMKLSTKN